MQAGQLRVRGVDGGQLFECAENTPCPGLAEHVGSQNWAWDGLGHNWRPLMTGNPINMGGSYLHGGSDGKGLNYHYKLYHISN